MPLPSYPWRKECKRGASAKPGRPEHRKSISYSLISVAQISNPYLGVATSFQGRRTDLVHPITRGRVRFERDHLLADNSSDTSMPHPSKALAERGNLHSSHGS